MARDPRPPPRRSSANARRGHGTNDCNATGYAVRGCPRPGRTVGDLRALCDAMKRTELEHIIRASGTIADVDDVIVIGSQAILGQFPDAPAELLISNEADVYPREHPDRG